MASPMEPYWSAAYWACVLAELVHIGVLGVEISGEVALYHVTEPFRERLESPDDRGLYDWLDEHFIGWSREPDGPAWRQ